MRSECVVGLLVAALAVRLPGTEVTAVDVDPSRAALAQQLGVAFSDAKSAPRGADLVIHTSASEAGLSLALECAGETPASPATWRRSSACALQDQGIDLLVAFGAELAGVLVRGGLERAHDIDP